MRCKGVALTPQERKRYNAIRGDVRVSPEVCTELGRCSNIARVSLSMQLEPEPLPQLLDASLAGMAPLGFCFEWYRVHRWLRVCAVLVVQAGLGRLERKAPLG